MEGQKEYSIDWAGRTLTIGVGFLAQQASGSCTVRYGDTVTLCTATLGTHDRLGIDYFPLMVDFEERLYAAGRIKGSRFIKREGRPTDEAVLSGRLIDRAIRPLFNDTIRRDVQVVATVLSHDQANDADILGLIGASCALAISNIPWNGPIAAIRVGMKDGAMIANPTYEETEEGGLDLVVSGTKDKIVMIESGANQLSEEQMLEAMKLGQSLLGPVIDLVNQVIAAHGKAKWDPQSSLLEEDKAKIVEKQMFHDFIMGALKTRTQFLWSEPLDSKEKRKAAIGKLAADLDAWLVQEQTPDEKRKAASELVGDFVEMEVSRAIIEDGKRIDGRGINEVRPLVAQVSILPRTHGSGLFMRGETQVLSAVTLGSPGMEQTIDTMEFQTTRRYFHHYNFPGYSVGEAKSNRGPGRREIGHGALAERAILPVLPTKEAFPYTVRVVSEVLGSNGSSSMGSTCGSTLALMDAGVPISAPVAGIAMGMASNEAAGKYVVITDLQDLEDGEGGMDFKVAGTKQGITAIQMDTKTSGLPWDVVVQAVNNAKAARMQILDVMAAKIPAVREELSKWAPRIESFRINPDKIRDVIGPGGKVINEIIAQTGVQIDIEDDGLVMVTSVDPEGMKKALDWIKNLTREVMAGETFTGPVTRIMDFGAFVEILQNKEGLVHISELAPERVATVQDVVKVGDIVTVKVYEIDSMGRVNLSIKRALPGYVEGAGDNRPLRDRKTGGGGGGGSRGGFGGGSRDRGPRRDSPRPSYGNGPSTGSAPTGAPPAPRPPMPDDPFDVKI